MNPQFPIYIVSKGRWDTRMTAKHLEQYGMPYFIIVEEQEFDAYAAVTGTLGSVLMLDKRYQDEYDTCDDLGTLKSKGPGAARNFAWAHAIAAGHPWHWVMDDNIRGFHRFQDNLKVPVGDGTIFKIMEDFVLRYDNIGMAGPNYYMFVPRKKKQPPFTVNSRIYSCNLIRNDLPFRWRGRYNEDTDLSLRILKSGLVTVQFNAFLQRKAPTQTVKGGNQADFYASEGTTPKSAMLVRLHPDVSRMTHRFGRVHHYVDYSRFKQPLIRKRDQDFPTGRDEYGMVVERVEGARVWRR